MDVLTHYLFVIGFWCEMTHTEYIADKASVIKYVKAEKNNLIIKEELYDLS